MSYPPSTPSEPARNGRLAATSTVATWNATGPRHVIRPVRPDELTLLPDLEAAADTVFEPLGIGPLPGPGTPEEFAAALVVLVAGDPPVGLCRIDGIDGGGAHLEQLSVHPDHAGHGIGRALLRAGCDWAPSTAIAEITLATYRDMPVERPLLRLGGLRRAWHRWTTSCAPTACRPRSPSWAASAPAS